VTIREWRQFSCSWKILTQQWPRGADASNVGHVWPAILVIQVHYFSTILNIRSASFVRSIPIQAGPRSSDNSFHTGAATLELQIMPTHVHVDIKSSNVHFLIWTMELHYAFILTRFFQLRITSFCKWVLRLKCSQRTTKYSHHEWCDTTWHHASLNCPDYDICMI